MTALLEAVGVTKTFGGGLFQPPPMVALEDFSFKVDNDSPAITAVVGESGSGKTTLARILLGETPPTAGTVHYVGKDLTKLSRSERRAFRRDVQVIFQDPYEVYNPFYTVDHVLTMPAKKFGLANSKAATDEAIREALRAVGLRPEETLGRYPHQLSGGQRQRITVARAILLKPRLIVADEPVSMVDASLRATILQTLRSLNEELGISFVYITHDLTTAYQVSDNILVLYRGRIAEAGAVSPVIRTPHHPYTRLLVGSIPLPDPNRRWGENVVAATADEATSNRQGCTFASRCPHVMDRCRTSVPPLYQLEPQRVSACFLASEETPSLPSLSGDITGVFAPTERLLTTTSPGGDSRTTGGAVASHVE